MHLLHLGDMEDLSLIPRTLHKPVMTNVVCSNLSVLPVLLGPFLMEQSGEIEGQPDTHTQRQRERKARHMTILGAIQKKVKKSSSKKANMRSLGAPHLD